jgi:pyruvate/2-oxoglutarate dehydrogenase complex dihydrolipoamide acyltransferase (E2) component
MFVDPPLHAEIQATGAKAGDTLEITPRKQGRAGVAWEVVQVCDEPAPAQQPAPAAQPARSTPTRTAPASQPAPRNATPAPEIAQPPRTVNTATVDLVTAFRAAIDATIEAQAYASQRGIDLRMSTSDIRSTAISVYIHKCDGGTR